MMHQKERKSQLRASPRDACLAKLRAVRGDSNSVLVSEPAYLVA